MFTPAAFGTYTTSSSSSSAVAVPTLPEDGAVGFSMPFPFSPSALPLDPAGDAPTLLNDDEQKYFSEFLDGFFLDEPVAAPAAQQQMPQQTLPPSVGIPLVSQQYPLHSLAIPLHNSVGQPQSQDGGMFFQKPLPPQGFQSEVAMLPFHMQQHQAQPGETGYWDRSQSTVPIAIPIGHPAHGRNWNIPLSVHEDPNSNPFTALKNTPPYYHPINPTFQYQQQPHQTQQIQIQQQQQPMVTQHQTQQLQQVQQQQRMETSRPIEFGQYLSPVSAPGGLSVTDARRPESQTEPGKSSPATRETAAGKPSGAATAAEKAQPQMQVDQKPAVPASKRASVGSAAETKQADTPSSATNGNNRRRSGSDAPGGPARKKVAGLRTGGRGGKQNATAAFSREDADGQEAEGKDGKKRNGRELLTEQEKRTNHILSEQKRRTLIRSGFKALADLIPGTQSASASNSANAVGISKSVILHNAVGYIRHLEFGNRSLMMQLENLQQRVHHHPQQQHIPHQAALHLRQQHPHAIPDDLRMAQQQQIHQKIYALPVQPPPQQQQFTQQRQMAVTHVPPPQIPPTYSDQQQHHAPIPNQATAPPTAISIPVSSPTGVDASPSDRNVVHSPSAAQGSGAEASASPVPSY
ncbi:uncharacterized protein EV422DRAFT_44905 [Fimicolochytrium jonesii]|uniref:uncharacterized protein n=1 Tax=Fimicolochytrium jonesii TaxID=1396493 RepID=UPI0022FDE8E4|nr:uncharacterized protein EV422DRAFT_44905 [Fimicolochytrium jonesii]KAI8821499.1 hypothetical protein EV422DRAFT_44905 [Fimicolochytrium jonesii]